MTALRERIEALPGMQPLLAALDGLPPAYLVGGAVRDLLRGGDTLDFDIVVEGDGREVAAALAERLGGEAVAHERFGTGTVSAPAIVVDVASARRETYAHPGALPDVEPDRLEADLARRDFTVNAMAAGLSGDDLGVLHDPFGGRADLEQGLIRVLHERSFLDDPTRLLRAARYAARLGGALEPGTERLARAAIEAGALETVSGERIRNDLLRLLRDPAMPDALAIMQRLGLDTALGLSADADRAASAALAAGETGADPALAALAATIATTDALARLSLPADERDRVARAAAAAPALARELDPELPPSRIHALLRGEPPEALALALAIGAPGAPVVRYLADLRDVRLEITGDDLVAAGVPSSPAIGDALSATLARKLDGAVSGRKDELALALRLARGADTRDGTSR